ncbi:XdhC family protein [Paeniglutamicibacter sp. ZC-3]|uniref:XdhC family protein n=1 Tax=Paeniglutamicibacter sp. ZC-3 TaxID=2986919 RepID=UPI0021F71B5A|nr:XdhC/CoxI family protein [Paeniglutamicibacter sp. ZC-3]MCV9994297.1 XdhC family protein [Paeniglutamicibacter sp. ZC-3]
MSLFWSQLQPVLDRGESFVLATVVQTSSSAPRETGTCMAIMGDGSVIGSVSGGCVESDIYIRAEEVLATGEPVLQKYGFTDDEAFTVGLTCGGTIHVYIERVRQQELDHLQAVAAAILRGEQVASVTVLRGATESSHMLVFTDRHEGNIGSEDSVQGTLATVRQMLARGVCGMVHLDADDKDGETGEMIFINSFVPPPRMIVFGTNDFAVALVRMGKVLGHHVTICDARGVFTTAERFPDADEIVVSWPNKYLEETHIDDRTILCVLTHDEKFDDPLLEVALRSPAAYVGAMGSRSTTDRRRERLVARGLNESELLRLNAPIGLDLGARTPEETAISILAEVISQRENASCRQLNREAGPIHATPLEQLVCNI